MIKRLGAEFLGTFWLVLGGAIGGLIYKWLGSEAAGETS